MAVLSITAASTGLTLTKASTVIFGEMHWTPSIMMQAEDRCHRNTQKQNVTCYYMFGNGTLDQYIYQLISSKFNTVSQMIDGEFRVDAEYMNQKYEGKPQNQNGGNNLGRDQDLDFDLNKKVSLDDLAREALRKKVYADIEDLELIKQLIESDRIVIESREKARQTQKSEITSQSEMNTAKTKNQNFRKFDNYYNDNSKSGKSSFILKNSQSNFQSQPKIRKYGLKQYFQVDNEKSLLETKKSAKNSFKRPWNELENQKKRAENRPFKRVYRSKDKKNN